MKTFKVKSNGKVYNVKANDAEHAAKLVKMIACKDEAPSREVLQQLLDDETSAIGAYNIAIKNEDGKLDDKAITVLRAIRDDEIRHRENLNAIMAGNVTEKNLEDSVKDELYKGYLIEKEVDRYVIYNKHYTEDYGSYSSIEEAKKAIDNNDFNDSVKDDHLSPSTYAALKKLGVGQSQWKNWTQEQASAYIAKRKGAKTEEKTEASSFSKKQLEKADKAYESIHKYGDVWDTAVENVLEALNIDADAWEEDRGKVSVSSHSKDDIKKAAQYFASKGQKIRVYKEQDWNDKELYYFNVK